MFTNEDLVICSSDAESLALMFGEPGARNRGACPEPLIELLQTADIVPDHRFPGDRIAMGSVVTYEDGTGAAPRRIVLAYPAASAPDEGFVSVLTPVGMALVGRRLGDLVEVALPNGRTTTVKIVAVERVDASSGATGHEGRMYA